jgi:hypothetical protein
MKYFLTLALLFSFSINVSSTEHTAEAIYLGDSISIDSYADQNQWFELDYQGASEDLLISIDGKNKKQDADIMVWAPGQQLSELPHCRPFLRSSDEKCLFKAAKSGVYKIKIHAVFDNSKMQLTAKVLQKTTPVLDHQKNTSIEIFGERTLISRKTVTKKSITVSSLIYNGYIEMDVDRVSPNPTHALRIHLLINNEPYQVAKIYKPTFGKSKVFYLLPILVKGDRLELIVDTNNSSDIWFGANLNGIEDPHFKKRKVIANFTTHRSKDVCAIRTECQISYVFESNYFFGDLSFISFVVTGTSNQIPEGYIISPDGLHKALDDVRFDKRNAPYKISQFDRNEPGIYHWKIDFSNKLELNAINSFYRDGTPNGDCRLDPGACAIF